MKTALEEAIEFIYTLVEIKEDNSFVTPNNKILSKVNGHLKSLLLKERKQIEMAHIEGQALIVKAIAEGMPKFDFSPTLKEVEEGRTTGEDVMAKDYFNKTYKTNQCQTKTK